MDRKIVSSLIGAIFMLLLSIVDLISLGLTITTVSTLAIFILFSYNLYKTWRMKNQKS
ncbi:hypothetical protein ACLJJ6_09040 [Pediococcus siamensis]|uniref:hypothetical protein n=1 Tax=Pediococcus siamensis TaxID=381829 RepID=UPI0039A023C0